MDLREKKTKRALSNAFLELRARKPLERVTIKELTELAEVSKATFYLHYKDVYDLSEQMQNDVIEKVLATIQAPELAISDPVHFTRELFMAFTSYQNVIDILFSGTQSAILPHRIEQGLKEYIFTLLPEKRDDIRFNVLLTYQIQGAYGAFSENQNKFGAETVMTILESHMAALAEV